MKIGGVINQAIFSTQQPNSFGSENMQSNKVILDNLSALGNVRNSSQLQKMMLQLQEQIKKIEESHASADVKSEQIKALQEQIQKLHEQFSKEQMDKTMEKQKEEKDEKEEVQVEQLRKEGFSIINSDFIRGIASSSSSMKLASVARYQYVVAKGRGNDDAIARSLNYQVSYSIKSKEAMKNIEISKPAENNTPINKEEMNDVKNSEDIQQGEEQSVSVDDKNIKNVKHKSTEKQNDKALDEEVTISQTSNNQTTTNLVSTKNTDDMSKGEVRHIDVRV